MSYVRYPVFRAAWCCVLAGYVVFLLPGDPTGEQAVQVWRIATPYPRDTVSGCGIERFAQFVERLDSGRTQMRSEFLASRPSDVVHAIQSGQLAVGDTLASSLVALDPVFELSMLPFEVRSIDEAKRLALLARPAYERALMHHGLHLLYVSPWPPSGLWSRAPVSTFADLAGLRIRTYDDASAAFLSSVGSQAVSLSVSEIIPRLRNGSLDGVLSSGDGEVGRLLRTTLPHFAAIDYAFPLSFALMSEARYDALPRGARERIDAAAMATEQQQWLSMPARIARNRDDMQRSGVMVAISGTGELSEGLRRRGEAWVAEWQSRVSPEYAGIVRQFRETTTVASYAARPGS
ncbi:TRAP transporter substrate-binding protein DctP [Paraburkholderia sp. HD33-4]|uniref:TRAP transporter substrate-binding protein DctP n=1 Tax=Paraburkholderia sp. HD33-4 TaxID=2883242 RepID=UPI001F1CF5B4|nr:TRAP transporter substrate-binding protein DctP [Paraburkholderia sp. HD33-4]